MVGKGRKQTTTSVPKIKVTDATTSSFLTFSSKFFPKKKNSISVGLCSNAKEKCVGKISDFLIFFLVKSNLIFLYLCWDSGSDQIQLRRPTTKRRRRLGRLDGSWKHLLPLCLCESLNLLTVLFSFSFSLFLFLKISPPCRTSRNWHSVCETDTAACVSLRFQVVV